MVVRGGEVPEVFSLFFSLGMSLCVYGFIALFRLVILARVIRSYSFFLVSIPYRTVWPGPQSQGIYMSLVSVHPVGDLASPSE